MVHEILMKLPEDVTAYILLRLPVKPLMRFKCIFKTWYILISSSTFINLHLDHIKTAKEEFIIFKRSVQEDPFHHKTVLSFLYGDDLISISPDLDVPYMASTFSSNYDQFIGRCHGIIALMNIVNTVLFNPAIRSYRLVPPCPRDVPKDCRCYVDGVGFGFDSIANDYKVVTIAKICDDRYPNSREIKVDVYDMSTDLWRELENIDQDLPKIYWAPCSLVYYKSSCHWLTILYFDMSTEIFNSINMPDTCNSYNGPHYGLVITNDSLTMMRYPHRNPEYDPAQELMQIWIMKEYGIYDSWIKIYTVRRFPIESPLAIWKDYQMLCQSRKGFLICYDIKLDKFRNSIYVAVRKV